MNVIFLDIDGVLNCVKTRSRNVELDKENPDIYHLDIEEEKVRILSQICKETDSKIVITSSWRNFWLDEEKNKTKLATKTEELLSKYNLSIYGFTPPISKKTSEVSEINEWREYDINAYLIAHPEVKYFCIIDDEDYDLSSFKNHLVLTSDYMNDKGEYGILERHKDEVKEKLKEPRPKYSNRDEINESFYIRILLNSILFEDCNLFELNMFIGENYIFFIGKTDSEYGKRTIRGTIQEKNNKYRITIYVFNSDKFDFEVIDDIELLDDKLIRNSSFSNEKDTYHRVLKRRKR